MLSYVVPVYNAAATLDSCADSLLRQTVELEVILVDDGSTDSSPALCDALAARDSRVRVIHRANGGVASARNAGMREARGEYIQFVDADDWLEPDCGALMEAAVRRENADFAVFGMVSDYIESGDSVPMQLPYSRVCRGHSEIAEAVLESDRQHLLHFPGNKLFSRAFLNTNGLQFPEVRGPVEDALFAMDCCRAASCIVMSDAIYYHYVQQNEGSMVRRYYEGLFDLCLEMNTRRRELYKAFGLNSEDAKNVCAELCFQQMLHGVKNLYRESSKATTAERRAVWRRIIEDAQLREDIERSAAYSTEARLIKLATAAKSPAAASAFFSQLMWLRQHSGALYLTLRRRFMLGKRVSK